MSYNTRSRKPTKKSVSFADDLLHLQGDARPPPLCRSRTPPAHQQLAAEVATDSITPHRRLGRRGGASASTNILHTINPEYRTRVIEFVDRIVKNSILSEDRSDSFNRPRQRQ